MTTSQEFADLSNKLRTFQREDYVRLRATLYYNLHTILEALDIAAKVSHDPYTR